MVCAPLVLEKIGSEILPGVCCVILSRDYSIPGTVFGISVGQFPVWYSEGLYNSFNPQPTAGAAHAARGKRVNRECPLLFDSILIRRASVLHLSLGSVWGPYIYIYIIYIIAHKFQHT